MKQFRVPVALTLLVLGAVALWKPSLLGVVVILSILEVSFSFDNAVVNAKILTRMSPQWQRIFLTVGVLIAVFGMRLVFPLIVVSLGGHLSPLRALDLGINQPAQYQAILEAAHPAIIGFGGIFLLMIFLDWVLGEKDINWLRPIERPLERLGKLDQVSVVISLIVLALVAQLAAADKRVSVLLAGAVGLAVYLLVNGVGSYFEEPDGDEGAVLATGKAGLATFLYLEVLDASFSFDGVVGAFAVTSDIFAIAIGLGIGALYVRSLTVYLVHQGTLAEYVHLDHGAHWAIGVLAVISLLTVRYTISEYVTGLLGVGFIAVAVLTSVLRRRRGGADEELPSVSEPSTAGAVR